MTSFEEWFSSKVFTPNNHPVSFQISMKAAFNAGVKSERERCAKLISDAYVSHPTYDAVTDNLLVLMDRINGTER
jgi:hypothetical protein